MSQVQGSELAIEMMQMGPQATFLQRAAVTEIMQYGSWSEVPSLSAQARAIAATMPNEDNWPSVVNHGTIYGVGDDNPQDPLYLTELQKRRAILVMFEHLTTFQIPRKHPIGNQTND